MRKKNIIIACIFIICLIVGTITTIMFINKKENEFQSLSSKYSEVATTVLKEMDIYEMVNEKDYSKTVEVMLEDDEFEINYLDKYYKINYLPINNFADNTNKLLDNNYDSDEVNYIFSQFNDNINILLNMEHIDILKFQDITNFRSDNLERYLTYSDEQDYDLTDVVTYVNIGLDRKGYSNYEKYSEEDAKDDLTILVNKYHKLPDDYEPSDLTSLSYNSSYKLRKEAAEAFEELTGAAVLDNVIFYPFSCYRSFSTQTYLYNNYKNRDGEAEADTYSARPGFSEHQLGLAVDIRSSSLGSDLTPNDYKWILNNSYKYGFIVRYPKDKQHITQFMEEPWHIRYLGKDLATKVHNSGLTYDEYYDLYMEDK